MLLGFIAVLIGFLVILYGRRQRRQFNLPAGAVAYEDLRRGASVSKTLVSARFGISGKPVLLIDTCRGMVPVELKHSGRPPRGKEPHDSHRAQLLVYCLLVEENFRVRVPYGIVRYQGDQDRVVPFDDHNRRWIFDVIEEIRTAREKGNQHRSHNKPARCIGCGFLGHCREAL